MSREDVFFFVYIVCCLTLAQAHSKDLQPVKVTASAECGGEIKLSIPAGEIDFIVSRSDSMSSEEHGKPSPLFEVVYKLADSESSMTKRFTDVAVYNGQYDLLLSGLQPGQQYVVLVQVVVEQRGQLELLGASDKLTSFSGTSGTEEAPAGVGDGPHHCPTRRRRRSSPPVLKGRVPVLKGKAVAPRGKVRVPRYTYTVYYTTYYYRGGSPATAGIVAGSVLAFAGVVAVIAICCKFYFYGGCGHPAYRLRHTAQTVMMTTGIPTAIPVALPVPTAAVVSEKSDEDEDDYQDALYPTKGPYRPPDDKVATTQSS